jgi:hypothetical protein
MQGGQWVCIKISSVGFASALNKRKITKYETLALWIEYGAFAIILIWEYEPLKNNAKGMIDEKRPPIQNVIKI